MNIDKSVNATFNKYNKKSDTAKAQIDRAMIGKYGYDEALKREKNRKIQEELNKVLDNDRYLSVKDNIENIPIAVGSRSYGKMQSQLRYNNVMIKATIKTLDDIKKNLLKMLGDNEKWIKNE